MATNFDPRVATLSELRDWHAQRSGHPVPATIDAAAALLPEGWSWRKCNDGVWSARLGVIMRVSVIDTGDEIADRMRLAALAIMEMEER